MSLQAVSIESELGDHFLRLITSPIDVLLVIASVAGVYSYGNEFFTSLNEDIESPLISDAPKQFDRRYQQLVSGSYAVSYTCWGLDVFSRHEILPFGEMAGTAMNSTALIKYTHGLMDSISDGYRAMDLEVEGHLIEASDVKVKKIAFAVMNYITNFFFMSYSVIKLAALVSAVSLAPIASSFFFVGMMCVFHSMGLNMLFKDAVVYEELCTAPRYKQISYQV